MQLLFNYYINRFEKNIQELLKEEISKIENPNPNEKVQKGCINTLKLIIKNEQQNTSMKFELAILCCYVTQKMKADQDFIDLLNQIEHPFISLYRTYFEEKPTNYIEAFVEIKKLSEKLEEMDDFTDEMRANLVNIHSWVYGQQGDIVRLKEIYKYSKQRISISQNPVEHLGLHEAYLNVAWWFLHSGIETDFDEMLNFIEPHIMKYKFYKTYTNFLNVKGSIESFLGDNVKGMRSFEELIGVHEEFHDDYRLSIATGNLAESYMVVGKINQAKEMMEKAIKLYKDSTGQWPYLYLTEIGNIYYILGDKRAEESFLHAYEIQKKEKSMHKAFIMYELVHFYLRTEDLETAKKYLRELRVLAKELETPSINARVDYLRGFFEMLNHNLSSAISYLQSALEQSKLTRDMEVILICNIQLTVAYLWYYRLLEKQESLNYAMTYINTVRQLAIESNHNQVLATSLMICSVLCALNGEYEDSISDLERARELSENIDLDQLKTGLNNIQNSIQQAMNTGQLEIHGQNVIEFILPQFKSLLSLKLVQTKTKEVDVLGVLIISDSGIPIFSKLKETLKTNDLLLSGLLMAITQFAESILEGDEIGRLKDVNYEDFCITLQAIKNGLIAVIASGVSSDIRMWSMVLADRIKEIPPVVTKFVSTIPSKIEDLLEEVNL